MKEKDFTPIRVTQTAHDVFRDYEQAVLRLAVATEVPEVMNAYSALCQRRKEIYQHIEAAESFTAWPRTVTLRF